MNGCLEPFCGCLEHRGLSMPLVDYMIGDGHDYRQTAVFLDGRRITLAIACGIGDHGVVVYHPENEMGRVHRCPVCWDMAIARGQINKDGWLMDSGRPPAINLCLAIRFGRVTIHGLPV